MERRNFLRLMGGGSALAVLAACADSEGIDQVVSDDGLLDARRIYFTRDGVTQWSILAMDMRTGNWIVNFGGETVTFGREFMTNLTSPAIWAQLIAGSYGVRIADASTCTNGVCGGTLIYNNGEAVALSESGSSAGVNSNTTVTVGTRSFDPSLLEDKNFAVDVIHDEFRDKFTSTPAFVPAGESAAMNGFGRQLSRADAEHIYDMVRAVRESLI